MARMDFDTQLAYYGNHFNSKRGVAIMVLTIEEKIEIIALTRNFSYQRTAQVFNESHSDRQPINKQTVARVVKYLRLRGTLHRKKRTIPEQNSQDIKDRVFEAFNNNPHASTRRIGIQLGISHCTVWRLLKKMKFRPYKMSKHQKLHADDPPKRATFCEHLLAFIESDPGFIKQILWTDEKQFCTNGCFNRQNFR